MNSTNEGGFRISQGFDLALPKGGNAYPIPCADWSDLKSSVTTMDTESSGFKDTGLVLLGAGVSTFITIMTGTFSCDTSAKYLPVAWSAVAITIAVGLCCLFFAGKSRKLVRNRATDIVRQMSRIEERFDVGK
jgi:hypothetical protein